MLELKLFGTGQARYFDQPLEGFPNQQAYSLLCYLLLNRHQTHHRERLAALFWGDRPTQVSRKHLRNALWRLRQGFKSAGVLVEDYLVFGDDHLAFSSSSRYSLDVEIFETTTDRYQDLAGEDLTPKQAAELEKAVELYLGDLLEGIYADWCLYDRERLRLLYLNTLSKLMAFHELNRTYERGLAYGERILACDPTREKVHRQMMRLYWFLRDRSAALTQYKRCVQILRDDLGVPPMPETRLMYEQMVKNQFDPVSQRPHKSDSTSINHNSDELLPLAEHALHKLQRLQETLEETSAELRHVERLINVSLLRFRRSVHDEHI